MCNFSLTLISENLLLRVSWTMILDSYCKCPAERKCIWRFITSSRRRDRRRASRALQSHFVGRSVCAQCPPPSFPPSLFVVLKIRGVHSGRGGCLVVCLARGTRLRAAASKLRGLLRLLSSLPLCPRRRNESFPTHFPLKLSRVQAADF